MYPSILSKALDKESLKIQCLRRFWSEGFSERQFSRSWHLVEDECPDFEIIDGSRTLQIKISIFENIYKFL